MELYGGWKINKQIRVLMYSGTIKTLYRPDLGKGARKKIPHCIQKKKHSFALDDAYTGFIAKK